MPNIPASMFDNIMDTAAQNDYSDAYAPALPAFPIINGDMVQVAVASIDPLKEEIDTLVGDALQDPHAYVPWKAGLTFVLLPIAVRRMVNTGSGFQPQLTTLIEGTEPSNMKQNFFITRMFESLRRADIERGYLKVFNAEGKTMKVTGFPPRFDDESPVYRFGFWWSTLSRKFARQQLKPGNTFWAYLKITDQTHLKNPDGTPKYKNPFRNLLPYKQTEEGLYINADATVGTFPLSILTHVVAELKSSYENKEKNDVTQSDIPF